MKTPSAPPASQPLPLPGRQFQRFVAVFHVVFLSGLAFVLFLRWRRPEMQWQGQDTALAAVVTVQAALYLRFFLRPPKQIGWWAVHFTAGFGFWLAEWRLEPGFEWVIFAYLGQMFGVLPPRFSLPASAAVFVTYFGLKLGWNKLESLSAWQWFAGVFTVGSWTALGLFLHRLVVTSSERARLIQELEAARLELELARQRDMELAALRERERLARDLHDSLGHALVTLTVQLEAVQRLLAVDPARAATVLEEMKGLSRRSMEDLRRALANLRTPGLGDERLLPALRRLCAEVSERTGLKVACQWPDDTDHVPPAVAEALWRVAREGLANVEKHARARQAQVSLSLQPQAIALRVVDDGCGLPPDAERKPGHYGLRGLRERIEGLGGVVALSPNSPHGTILEARVPLIS